MNQELKEAFERAREASKERKIREATPRHINQQIEREKHGAWVEVRHPAIGTIRVKARSNYDAQCAAEDMLGLERMALSGCEVWSVD